MIIYANSLRTMASTMAFHLHDHKRPELHYAQTGHGIGPKCSPCCCPWGLDVQRRVNFFLPFFFDEKSAPPFSCLGQRSFGLLWQNTCIHLCVCIFCRGVSFSRKPIVSGLLLYCADLFASYRVTSPQGTPVMRL